MTDDAKKFDELSTEQLREMAAETDNGQANWLDWDRAMLLAFFHNRRDQFAPKISETK